MIVAVAAPSLRTIFLDWHLDPAMSVLMVVLVGLYLGGVRRLAGRERPVRWPPGRTAAYLSGVFTIGFATQSGLARYDVVLFSLHVVQHVLLGMIAPLLLALGAPITLALQAARRATQTTLLRWIHSPVVRVLSHPVVVWGLFGGTLFALYFSPLFALSLRNPWVHQAIHLHFLLVGCLFCWTAVGIDPIPHRIPHLVRLLFVLFAVPFHAFLGLAVLSADAHPLGGSVYGKVVRHWGGTLVADQHVGAGILWGIGDLWGLLAGGIVLTQWIKADQKRQAREDRRLDAELAAGQLVGEGGPHPPQGG